MTSSNAPHSNPLSLAGKGWGGGGAPIDPHCVSVFKAINPMRFLALATDYDGTLAHHGRVDEPALEALERLRESGRKLILVTGRELGELLGIFPQIELFDRVVAENGALLYRPESREEKALGERRPTRSSRRSASGVSIRSRSAG